LIESKKGDEKMNAGLADRTVLVKLIERMNDTDIKQVLAYAAGYEACKIGQLPSHIKEDAGEKRSSIEGR